MTRLKCSCAAAVLLILLGYVGAWSQEASLQNLPVQAIGKDDLISITVYGSPEFTRTLRVSDAGDVALPMMKSPVHAEGLTPVQLETALQQAFEAAHLLVRPAVTVTVAEYRSRTVTITGAVHKPIAFQQLGPLTLAEAISRAEGLNPEAADEIVIVRAADAARSPGDHIERVRMSRTVEGSMSAPDVQIHAGDEIRVPVAERIFVVGSVRKPGAYRAEGGETVLSMLAVSEGLLPYAMKTAYVYRKTAEGRQELAIPLAQILGRKASDVPLQGGDVFYVADDKTRRLTLTAVDRIVNFGAGTTSGLLIWRK